MKYYRGTILPLLVMLTLQIQPGTVAAQSSVGFAEPQDNTNLLEYRLPDWSYRIWDASLDLSGSGSDLGPAGQDRINNKHSGLLGTRYRQNWDSEQRLKYWSAIMEGTYFRTHSGTSFDEDSSKRLTGNFNFGAGWQEYVGQGRFNVFGNGQVQRLYAENKMAARRDDVWTEAADYSRYTFRHLTVGVGWGRARNVVPLLRAERLSERLAALGRPTLTRQQVQAVARILATENGYRQVFDRSDRHFWRDVLEPMLDDSQPLDPYEIFYLTDVLNEDLGDRFEGFETRASYVYFDRTTDLSSTGDNSRNRGPQLSLAWYHNLSLSQQIHLFGRLAYSWNYLNESARETAHSSASVVHLWNLADRYRLETTLSYSGQNFPTSDTNVNGTGIFSSLHVFLEDQASLVARVGAKYRWEDYASDEQFGWTWQYSLGLTYHLDRAIF